MQYAAPVVRVALPVTSRVQAKARSMFRVQREAARMSTEQAREMRGVLGPSQLARLMQAGSQVLSRAQTSAMAAQLRKSPLGLHMMAVPLTQESKKAAVPEEFAAELEESAPATTSLSAEAESQPAVTKREPGTETSLIAADRESPQTQVMAETGAVDRFEPLMKASPEEKALQRASMSLAQLAPVMRTQSPVMVPARPPGPMLVMKMATLMPGEDEKDDPRARRAERAMMRMKND